MPFPAARQPRTAWLAGLALALGATAAAAAPVAPAACASPDELTALRARVAELEARLAGQAPPAALAAAPAPPPAPPPSPTPSLAPTVSVTTTTVAGAPMSPPPPQVQTIVTRDGTTIRAITVETLPEEPYSRAGCSLGFLAGTPPGKWKDADAWDQLSRNMTPAQVTDLLGVEHHDAGSAQRRLWEYGKCGNTVAGTALFVDGRLADWRTPGNLR